MPATPCPHEKFGVETTVNRLSDVDGGPITSFSANIKIICMTCGEQFVWIGPMPVGVDPRRPAISVDGTELRAPIRPQSSSESFGQVGKSGYTLQMWDRPDGSMYG